ncbi:MAG TPA: hypothetical protein VKN36_01190 [Eudoraea sp.]|nr:hypothetical protein [Eudoraea sp.]
MNNSKYIKEGITEKELYQTAFESSLSGIPVVDGYELGHHIVKQCTVLMRGTISLTGKPGKGSTFTV